MAFKDLSVGYGKISNPPIPKVGRTKLCKIIESKYYMPTSEERDNKLRAVKSCVVYFNEEI